MASANKAAHFPNFDNGDAKPQKLHPLKALVKKLTETYGPSGHEQIIRELIRDEIKGLADEVRVDALGNLIARKKGTGATPRKKIMLAAHMDEIGVMVTHVDEKGFVRFASIGGVFPVHLIGNRCLFANGVIGTFGQEKKDSSRTEVELNKMFIDVGARDQKSALVRVGDAAGFWRDFVDLGDRMMAKAMDDRIGCAVLIETMRQLKKSPHDVYFVFTVQEEVGVRGATTSAYGVQPDLALAVDVTDTGDTPESTTMAVGLGNGPAIKVKDSGMLAHPVVKKLLVDTAEEFKIPYQLEVLVGGSTDAMAMQISREGVPAGCVSIPERYVHSPSEMVDFGDMQNAVKLVVNVLSKPIKLD
ncbi:MAG: M42 family metallopeptidase [Chloroflexota bacterium]|nr:M42 family metallopeptidase [Chloroflexota bacterium]